jgi:beta-lactamase superfamily II metal-dependent hydrolase
MEKLGAMQMYEIDFLPVGNGEDSGDAITMRFTRPDTGGYAHVIIDGGFRDDGEALVEHVKEYYGTSSVDLAILTHPDGDHIGGMGEVIRGLSVSTLWLHQIGAHGGASLPASEAVEELIGVALAEGTEVREAWAGAQAFGGALTILGPDRAYYEALVAEQVAGGAPVTATKGVILEAVRGLWDRITGALPVEIPFAEKDVIPRNNSSMITLLRVNDRSLLFTGDAGVPALERGWDRAESLGFAEPPAFVQIPHHGSRRNCSSAWLDRLLGSTGQAECRTAFVSVVAGSEKHPSGRVVNAHIRRGCMVVPTAGSIKWHSNGAAPPRPNWGPATPLRPMDESGED